MPGWLLRILIKWPQQTASMRPLTKFSKVNSIGISHSMAGWFFGILMCGNSKEHPRDCWQIFWKISAMEFVYCTFSGGMILRILRILRIWWGGHGKRTFPRALVVIFQSQLYILYIIWYSYISYSTANGRLNLEEWNSQSQLWPKLTIEYHCRNWLLIEYHWGMKFSKVSYRITQKSALH